ncbi:hypothetical protein DM860_016599 [Cuscuta australis]|uniref:Uncharacterized protein n=1 Tax=Cuscuta australis TaxID=267555 RepID=A0A328DMS0_9ASTE|nr:hypothetical protein DM860_016599 [Cuscuta australis]
MDSRTPPPKRVKRPLTDFYSDLPKKRISDDRDAGSAHKKQAYSEMFKRKECQVLRICSREDEDGDPDMVVSFRVLMPNGTTLEMKVGRDKNEMSLSQLVDAIKTEYMALKGRTWSQKRQINWNSPSLYILDPLDRKIKGIDLRKLNPRKTYMLRLHNMWDLTPDTDLLKELPEEYTFESALADLIDNSLQAVWSNPEKERRLISVKLSINKIIIFDTGPGMDGSVENSIAKWGKMGASLHRSSKGKAIGCKPPYLKPYFGMFGYGGPIASMHLGRRAIVSSKTKASKKVYILHLERDDLLNCSSSENTWRTNGGLRDPFGYEVQESPHGSFTKVEILEPKMRCEDIKILQGKLKDIYFPYIQCDEISETGRTAMPTEFQVNGTNLAEILSGEVALMNLFSCNGPDFTLELHFTSGTSSIGGHHEANARLKCVYFPVIQGKESIEKIIENLKQEGYETLENFESFSRVSVRRLGRMLPDARWPWLPFMEPRQRKADSFKRCWFRVKCFVDTDAGFNPTPAKTNLAQCNPFTIALKQFGNKPCEKDVHIEICKDGKPLSLTQLEKVYHDWVLNMHNRYDCEIESGDDQPIIVLSSENRKELGTSSDVLRVHRAFQRKGITWRSGQKIKILKGACPGFNRTNIFATLEFIILEGCEGDGGDAWIVCRQLGVHPEDGCRLSLDKESPHLDLRGSKSLPFSVIDSDKCIQVDDTEWEHQLDKYHQEKTPSSIELLDAKDFPDLNVDETLPHDVVDAGHDPPEEIYAIVRPSSSKSAVASKKLDQKYILRENFEMILNIRFSASDKNDQCAAHVYSLRTKPSSHNGVSGVYVFPLRMKLPELFHKAGVYSFLFSLNQITCGTYERKVHVRALSETGSWGLSSKNSGKYKTRIGMRELPPIYIACYDKYMNSIQFKPFSDVEVKLHSERGEFAHDYSMDAYISKDKLTLTVKGLVFESSELDKIGPSYETTLSIGSKDEPFSVTIQVQVLPGPPHHVSVHPLKLRHKFIPGTLISELKLELFDEYNNHIQKEEEIQLQMDGFCAPNTKSCLLFKVDENGCINLGGILKVTAGYGKTASLSVFSGEEAIFKKDFQIEKRELHVASEIPEFCVPGYHLENVVFEVIDSEGEVDESIHDDEKNGQPHTLIIKSEWSNIDENVRYSFRHGRCTVCSISLPEVEGKFQFLAVHSRHLELQLRIEVNTKNAAKLPSGNLQSHNPVKSILKEVEAEQFQSQNINIKELAASRGLESEGEFITIHKKLEDAVCHYAQLCAQCETELQVLDSKQSNIRLDIFNLEDSLGLHSSQNSCCSQELIIEQICYTNDSAAAITCSLIEAPSSKESCHAFSKEILGVVALLGFTETNEFSRMLAEYLGEKQMLAVVCKAHAPVGATQMHAKKHGHLNGSDSLCALANHLGISIKGGYDIICLDDIRPYTGEMSYDPQRKLALPNPTLPNGESPPGFLGYAVNMIHISANHLQYRTASGHGLHETLFYRLLGDLQVYSNRDSLIMASSLIHSAPAISLDGVIIRGNGVTSLVLGDPLVRFPVISREQQPETVNLDVLNLLDSKKMELREVQLNLDDKRRVFVELKEKFSSYRNKYLKFCSRDNSPDVEP